jgi:hypothetical protein
VREMLEEEKKKIAPKNVTKVIIMSSLECSGARYLFSQLFQFDKQNTKRVTNEAEEKEHIFS